jgi:hypothetical protein
MHEAKGERIFVLVRDANDEDIASLSQSVKTSMLGAYLYSENGGFHNIIVATMC